MSIREFSIVVPEGTAYDSNVYYAAELLYEYIKKATGADLAIEWGAALGEHAIYIHSVADDSELGSELGHEGYKYEVVDGDLHIYGTHRGNMYAAYEIIEDYLGFNFFSKYETYSKKQRAVDMEEGLSKTFVPGYRFRHSKSTYNSSTREYLYLARRLNGAQNYQYKNEKRSLEYYGDFVGPVYVNIHTYYFYHQMATGTMPEDDGTMDLEQRYYAKYQSGEVHDIQVWQPCATNETQYQLLFQGFRETLAMVEARGYPIKYADGTNCFSFSSNDNTNWCTCRDCTKAIRAGETYPGLYLALANRGAEDIQAYYPGLKVFSIIATVPEVPVNVKPSEHLILVLCGPECTQHTFVSEDCVHGNLYGNTNMDFADRLHYYMDMCKETGAELWTWYYPETHYFEMFDIPNVYNIYYDIKWYYEQGITGFFYEGMGSAGYNFEHMKAYLAAQVMFDPEMTYEEYDQLVREYCDMAYGAGGEYVYEYLQMYLEASDQVGLEFGEDHNNCYVSIYDRAYDLVSVVYLRENYETMRNLLLSAIEAYENSGRDDTYREKRLYDLFNCFEILGLGAVYATNYTNGTEEQRSEYEQRFNDFFSYYKNSGMKVSYFYPEYNTLVPSEIDLSEKNPCYYFLPGASWRASITALLG